MTSAKNTPANPATSGALARLLTVSDRLRRTRRDGGAGGRSLKRWLVRLAALIVALVVLWQLFLVAVRIATTQMWFDSVHHGGVYQTTVKAQILLFCVFGVLASVVSGLSIVAVRRFRSPLYVSQDDDTFRWIFRKYEPRFTKLIVAVLVIAPGVIVGRQAASGWQTYLMWDHAQSWGSKDPLFHKDISFYVDVYPFHTMVISLLTQAVTYGLWIVAIGGYWYGGWRLRRGRQKVIRDFTRVLSLLLGVFLILKAANYWLSRYALTTSGRGPVTGASYTDANAALPGKYVLVVVALLAGALLIVNGIRAGQPVSATSPRALGRLRTLAGTLVVMAAVAALAGSALPGLVYHFREAPSAARVDLSEIRDNQKATLAAFGLKGVTPQPYAAQPAASTDALVAKANETAQMSVLDPNQVSPTFNVEQQLQAYYGFKSTLDTGSYPVDGKPQDVALAVRELRAAGIPQTSWVNQHLVYTHGYGVVAAPTNRVDPKTHSPVYLNGGIPPSQDIPVDQPQVYFGQSFSPSSYAIVGQPAGSAQNLEFDHPGSSGSAKSAYATYSGDGGISIGSTLRKFLFAVQLRDSNIFFSSELNSASQLLTLRDPRSRVAKVAPWLTLDGDVYPAVVDGHIEWIADGYTTTSNYPYSQLVNLRSASSTTLTANGASITQPSTQINYMQNSVKAIVDAYTGSVTLYEWNQSTQRDPLLKTWESVYPGLVKPQADIPAPLLSALRYPTDLFNVQRSLLAKYHVTSASSFYSGNDYWKVPTDPTVAAANSINATAGQNTAVAAQPSRYMSMAIDDTGQQYSLSSPMVTLNGQQVAGFVYVNSTPGPNYGKFTVLDFPTNSGSESPAQVQNDIESNTTITESLTLQRGGNSTVVLGDIEAIPVAGRLLYIEPIYTQSSGSSSFPILRHVIALYGDGDPSFEDDLQTAVKSAIADVTDSG